MTAGTDAASITIGRMTSYFLASPLVQYAVLPWATSPAPRRPAGRRTPD